MKVDRTDVDLLRQSFLPLVQRADGLLESLFSYLMPGAEFRTDFADVQQHLNAAKNISDLLDVFAELQCRGAWLAAVEHVMSVQGDNATVEHVTDILLDILAGRASRMIQPNADPLATVYGSMVTSGFGQMVGLLKDLPEHDARLRANIKQHAAALGMSEDTIYHTIRAGGSEGEGIIKRLKTAHLEAAAAEYTTRGEPVPQGLLDAMAEGAGGAAVIPADMVAALNGMGVNASNVTDLGDGTFAIDVDPTTFARLSEGNGGMPGIAAVGPLAGRVSEDASIN